MTWSPRNSRPEDDEDDDEGPLNHSHEPHSPSISVHSDEFKHDTSNLSSEEKKNEGTPKRKIWSITETLQQQASTNSSPDDSKSVRTVSPPSSSSSSDNNQTTATPSVPPMAASQVFPGFPGMPFFAPNPAMMNAMNPMALFAAMQQQTASMRMNPLQNLLFNQQFNQLGRNAVPNPEINPITLLQNMMKAENASGSNSKNEVKAESTGEREARSSCNSSAEPNSPLFGNCALKEEERSTSAGKSGLITTTSCLSLSVSRIFVPHIPLSKGIKVSLTTVFYMFRGSFYITIDKGKAQLSFCSFNFKLKSIRNKLIGVINQRDNHV